MRPALKRLFAASAPLYRSDFTAGVDSFVQNIGDANLVLAGNVDGISGVDDVLSLLASGANKAVAFRRSGFNCQIGSRYSITFDYFADTGAFASTAYLGTGISLARTDRPPWIPIVENAWQFAVKLKFTQRNEAALNSLFLCAFSTPSGGALASLQSGTHLYFKNFVLRHEPL